MCQATVYLDGEEILKDVMIVENRPEGIMLVTLFEPPKIVPAIIRRIDLIEHRLILDSQGEVEHDSE